MSSLVLFSAVLCFLLYMLCSLLSWSRHRVLWIGVFVLCIIFSSRECEYFVGCGLMMLRN